MEWHAKKLEELNQKVPCEYYLSTLIETAQDEETRQRLRELPEEMKKCFRSGVATKKKAVLHIMQNRFFHHWCACFKISLRSATGSFCKYS